MPVVEVAEKTEVEPGHVYVSRPTSISRSRTACSIRASRASRGVRGAEQHRDRNAVSRRPSAHPVVHAGDEGSARFHAGGHRPRRVSLRSKVLGRQSRRGRQRGPGTARAQDVRSRGSKRPDLHSQRPAVPDGGQPDRRRGGHVHRDHRAQALGAGGPGRQGVRGEHRGYGARAAARPHAGPQGALGQRILLPNLSGEPRGDGRSADLRAGQPAVGHPAAAPASGRGSACRQAVRRVRGRARVRDDRAAYHAAERAPSRSGAAHPAGDRGHHRAQAVRGPQASCWHENSATASRTPSRWSRRSLRRPTAAARSRSSARASWAGCTAMARTHSLLLDAEWRGTELQALVEQALEPLPARPSGGHRDRGRAGGADGRTRGWGSA